jgi:hypothetical protein
MSYAELLNELDLEFGIVLLPDTLRHIIARLPFCKTVAGIPQDASRVECDESEIDAFYAQLEQIITSVPACVIYNVDEVGFDSWVDATRTSVIVPADYQGDQIAMPVTRSDARATMVACIAANDRSLKPLIVIPRKSVEAELFECGFTPDCCAIHSQPNVFMTTALFEEWFLTIFIADTLDQRRRLGYAGMVFLIHDGFSAHMSEAIEEACIYYGVQMLKIPAHPSDQVQPLDVGLFALHRSESRRMQTHLDLNLQTVKLIRVLCGFQKAATPVNIIGAFRKAGIISQWDGHAGTLRCIIDRNQATEVQHWRQSKKKIAVQQLPFDDRSSRE